MPPTKGVRKHQALIILSALLKGHSISVGDQEWRYEGGVFGVVRGVWKNDKWIEDRIFGVDMTVGAFVKWCEKLPEEVLVQTAFQVVMAETR